MRLYDPRYRVGFWPLSGHVGDVSGYGEDGSWDGSAAYEDGPFGRQVGLFNATRFVDLGSPSRYNFVTPFSLSVWVRWSTNLDDYPILARWPGYLLRVRFNAIDMTVVTGGVLKTTTSAGTYQDNIWHHAVGVYDGTNVLVYVDGDRDTNRLAVGGALDDAAGVNMAIGAYPGPPAAQKFVGNIALASIYNVALTQDEVLDLYHFGRRS